MKNQAIPDLLPAKIGVGDVHFFLTMRFFTNVWKKNPNIVQMMHISDVFEKLLTFEYIISFLSKKSIIDQWSLFYLFSAYWLCRAGDRHMIPVSLLDNSLFVQLCLIS